MRRRRDRDRLQPAAALLGWTAILMLATACDERAVDAAACSADDDCASGRCAGGACLGSDCHEDAECGDGWVCEGKLCGSLNPLDTGCEPGWCVQPCDLGCPDGWSCGTATTQHGGTVTGCGYFPPVFVDAGGPYTGYVGDSIAFEASLDPPAGYELAEVSWLVRQGEGSSVEVYAYSELSFEHVFTRATTEPANVSVTLSGPHGGQISGGDMAEVTMTGSVVDAGGPYEGSVGNPVELRGTVELVPSSTVASVEWTYKDELVATAANEDVIFDEPTGLVTEYVRLRVTDSTGQTFQDSAKIELCVPAMGACSSSFECCSGPCDYDEILGESVCQP